MSKFEDIAKELALSIEKLNGRLDTTNALLERNEKATSKKLDEKDVLLILNKHYKDCGNERDSTPEIKRKFLSDEMINNAKLVGFMIGSALAALGITNIF